MHENVYLVSAVCTAEGMSKCQIDWSTAFLTTPEERTNQYCELPFVPASLQQRFGRGRCREKVGRTKKKIYGQHDAGRGFSWYVLSKIEVIAGERDIDVHIFITDRCIISFKWKGQYLVILLNVDDGLVWHTNDAIRDDVLRRLRRWFIISVQDTDTYCGIDIENDPQRRITTFSQHRHLELMLEIWGMRDTNPARQPWPPGAAGDAARLPWSGAPTEREVFDYAMFIGDAVWLSRTLRSITWAVHILAQHIRNPGPAHVHAAKHLLRYIKHMRDAKLTCDASTAALSEGWPRRHKIIIDYDASLPVAGARGTTGALAYINGLCFASVARRQTSISNNSFEAESKGAQLATELVRGYQDTLAELLEIWPASPLANGDARGAIKQFDRQTDKRAHAALKRVLNYTEAEVNSGRTMMNCIPREHNTADNNTQQGGPYDQWLARTNTIMGTPQGVYVSDTVRAAIRFDREQRDIKAQRAARESSGEQ